MRTVTVEDCSDCTFVFSSVSSLVQISSCSGCTFIFASRCVHLQNLTSCTVHLATPLRPYLSGQNENLILGPYHICYKSLESDLNRAGLRPSPNLWNKPFQIEKTEKNCWELMHPKDFFYYVMPFDLDKEKFRKRFAFPLEAQYADAITQKEEIHKLSKAKIKVKIFRKF